MKAKLHLVCSITIFFSFFSALAQQKYWTQTVSSGLKSVSLGDISSKDLTFTLDASNFAKVLQSVQISKSNQAVVYLPIADGTLVPFNIREKSVFHPDLAQKYPQIKSYIGQSLDNTYRVRFSNSHKGIQSMMVNLENHETIFMEPVIGQKGVYVVYGKNKSAKSGIDCDTKKGDITTAKTINPLVNDQTLRTFRIAIATSGEYTAFHGGTIPDALAAINTTLTRVNEVYETDLGVSLELIANNDEIIFINATTDPFTGNFNAEAQNTLTSIIGEANYDIGHLFTTAPQGQNNGNAGGIGTVCRDNIKGSAFTAVFMPEGDVFDIDFVAHEFGHQFGANHTWSFQSEGTGVQAEPGSGSTIMGFAGIVAGNNVQANSDDYFHYNNIVQIRNYLETVSCGTTQSIVNAPPVVAPVDDFTIPIGTAFVLEGIATDPDVDDILTFTWEQIDDGVVTAATFGPENVAGSNFRSLAPTTDPARFFPRLSSVLQGNLTQTNPNIGSPWETVSNVQRNLNFALTVRDNALGGGQVISDLLEVNVVSASGPFVVISQSNAEVYTAGSTQTVTWDVAETDSAPVNAQTVDVFLSTDGGNTFPILLLENTLNDGSEDILLPGDVTTSGRIMVKAHDNIFFAVNSSDFTIETAPVVLDFESLAFEVCQPDDLIIPFVYQTFDGFNELSTFSAENLPTGLSVIFTPNQSDVSDTLVNMTLTGTNAVPPGVYPITVRATSPSQTTEVEISITIRNAIFPDVVLVSPADDSTDVSLSTDFDWELDPNATSYDIEIATDVFFFNLVDTANVRINSFSTSNLEPNTDYFWRIRPQNICGQGTFSPPFIFTTINIDCQTRESGETPVAISQAGISTEIATVQFIEDLPVADVNVSLDLTHTFVGDLVINLISPSGTRVNLLSNNCGGANNVNAVFDDDGADIVCSGNPVISGIVRPLGDLSVLDGESSLGVWTLEVQDTAPGDGGAIEAFSLEVCVEGNFRPDADGDGVFDDGDDLCLGTPEGVEVDVTGCPVNRLPADNFLVRIESETCRANNDGFIEITPVNTSLTYTAILDDGTSASSLNFSDSGLFDNLSAGNYNICITATDGTIIFQETCFDVVLTEPEPLSVFASVSGAVVSLTLSGGDFYNIELNGVVTQTGDDQIQLNLKEGVNTLRVFTSLPCQGTYVRAIVIGSIGVLYPNPVGAETKLLLNDVVGSVNLRVFSTTGRLVMEENRNVNGNELIMDFSVLATGTYFLRVKGEGFEDVFKMIRE